MKSCMQIRFSHSETIQSGRKTGINIAPNSVCINTRKRIKSKEKLRRCCSLCSIGQRCLKYKEKGPEEMLEGFLSSRETAEKVLTPLPSPEHGRWKERERQQNSLSPSFLRLSGRMQAKLWAWLALPILKDKGVVQAPLREDEGPMRLKVNFSMGDLGSWKAIARTYREDPTDVAKKFTIFTKALDPDWDGSNLRLDALQLRQ